MTREIIHTTSFRRDVKRLKKQGNPCLELLDMYEIFRLGQSLPRRLQDHALKGDWNGHRELHLAPHWLLIYRVIGDAVYFVRTGSHSELFGE